MARMHDQASSRPVHALVSILPCRMARMLSRFSGDPAYQKE